MTAAILGPDFGGFTQWPGENAGETPGPIAGKPTGKLGGRALRAVPTTVSSVSQHDR